MVSLNFLDVHVFAQLYSEKAKVSHANLLVELSVIAYICTLL